jgi:hypothetical protein
MPSVPLSDRRRSQKVHITDANLAPILSTNPSSTAFAAVSQALVTSNSAVEHLGLGRIRGVHAHYMNGEVVQSAKLEGNTGVVATVAGKQVRKKMEVEKMLNVVHGALNEDAETEEIQEANVEGRERESSKSSQERAG